MIKFSQSGSRLINHLVKRATVICRQTHYHRITSRNVPPVCISVCQRHLSTQTGPPMTCQALQERGLVRVAGEHAGSFLQGLITNDIRCLESICGVASPLYAMMLNVQGRVLYDLIIYNMTPADDRDELVFLVECQKDVIPEFLLMLKRYKLRKKVSLSDVSDDLHIWAVFGGEGDMPQPLNLCDASQVTRAESDPRLRALGYRLILPSGVQGTSVVSGCEAPENPHSYKLHRYKLGIGEGTTDLPLGACFPLECNAVFLNGVSFSKGCYIGQELTARTYHTGVIRKRLMPITLSRGADHVQPGDSIVSPEGKVCGKVRGNVGHQGLALLRVAEVVGHGGLAVCREEGKETVTVGECEAHVPSWWPSDRDEVIRMALGAKEGKG